MVELVIDELIRSKRRSVSLTISQEGRLIVRAPLRLPLREIQKLIQDKRDWIIDKKRQAIERVNQAQNFSVQHGGTIPFLGETLKLIMTDKVRFITLREGELLIPSVYQEKANPMLKKWYQNQAKALLNKRIAELSKLYGIPFQECRITSARKRWGSCNSKNNINLTWRLIMANQRAVDYVIVHELCHVIHKNHSSAFWHKVRDIMPDFAIHRKWLRDHAYILDVLE